MNPLLRVLHVKGFNPPFSIDPGEAFVEGCDFRGSIMTKFPSREKTLVELDLRQTTYIKEAAHFNTHLEDVDLSGSTFIRGKLNWTDVIFTDLSYTNLQRCKFYRCHLHGANFSHANLRGAEFGFDAHRPECNFDGADLRGALFVEVFYVDWGSQTFEEMCRELCKGAIMDETTIFRSHYEEPP